MKMIHCSNCGNLTGHKRNLGIGTLIMVLITSGLWLLTIPFYPIRCIVCGNKAQGIIGVMRSDGGFRIRLFQYRECYRISNCRLSQFTIWVRGFPHYKADNTPDNLRLGGLVICALNGDYRTKAVIQQFIENGRNRPERVIQLIKAMFGVYSTY